MEKEPLVLDTFDHLVLTTRDLAKCLDFYAGTLGMRHEVSGVRHSLHGGGWKINIHTTPGEFQPAAASPTPGSLDLCFIIRSDLETALATLEAGPYKPISGIAPRTGARGPMHSIYLRDPDGNLIELARYDE